MKKRSKLGIIIFVFLLVTVLYPLLMMLIRVEWSDFGNLISSTAFKEALNNSLCVTFIATILSV